MEAKWATRRQHWENLKKTARCLFELNCTVGPSDNEKPIWSIPSGGSYHWSEEEGETDRTGNFARHNRRWATAPRIQDRHWPASQRFKAPTSTGVSKTSASVSQCRFSLTEKPLWTCVDYRRQLNERHWPGFIILCFARTAERPFPAGGPRYRYLFIIFSSASQQSLRRSLNASCQICRYASSLCQFLPFKLLIESNKRSSRSLDV